MQKQYDLVIIGGGQAGLAAAYYARRYGLSYIVLEASQMIGQSWQNRYDSLTLFTPRAYSALPGLLLPGDAHGYPTKNEVATYLQQYATCFDLAVARGETVASVTKEGTRYRIVTNKGRYESSAVVVATGPFQTPRLPDYHSEVSIQQLHSNDYRNPAQVTGEKVLVVGGGNSGAQIAEELARERKVTLAVAGTMRFMPATVTGKSLFWWLDTLGLLNARTDSLGAKLLRRRGDPIIGTGLKRLIRQGIIETKPAVTGGNDNRMTFADGSSNSFDAVIWCTGYVQDYAWLHIPSAFDTTGRPIHAGGVAEVSGLYFLGLSWMRCRNSALLGGVGRDAEFVVKSVAHR